MVHLAKMKAFLCLYVCLYFVPTECRKTYEGHLVLRIIPKSAAEVQKVRHLFSQDKGFDVWRNSTKAGSPFDVRLSPEQYTVVQQQLTELDLDNEVMISDVQTTADDQQRRSSTCSDCFDLSSYHTLDEINHWIQHTAQTYSDIAEEITVSTSYENRAIKGIKISTANSSTFRSGIWLEGGIHAREWIAPATVIYLTSRISTANSSTFRSGIWLEGGIHAREWIAPATVIYLTSRLLDDYKHGHASTVNLVDGFEWYIIPVLNVDGYVFTWTDDRMWRKTRSDSLHGTDCVGVDPNRNWDCNWGGTKEGQNRKASSGEPCANTYRGPHAFSEPSVKGVADYLLGLSSKVSFKVFLDFHSYSQMWMSPWGYTEEKPEDYNTQDKASVAAISAIAETSGRVYDHGPIASTIYPANGNSVDWAYAELGATFSAAVELRDTGKHGFLLPPEQIVPCGEEIYAGVVKYVEYVMANN